MMAAATNVLHVTPRAVPYYSLNVAGAFAGISPSQRLYSHYFMQAGWQGTAICAMQLSPESLPLLKGFHKLFSEVGTEDFRKRVGSAVPADAVAQFLEYVALLYSNMGNYLSFGDSKFIPACSAQQLEMMLNVVNASASAELLALVPEMYNLEESKLSLAYPPRGVSAYYSSNIVEADVTLANAFLTERRINGINTRVFKSDADGSLTIRVASVEVRAEAPVVFQGRSITLEYGDFSAQLTNVVASLKMAQQHAANDTQKRMINHYIAHFTTGDVEEHRMSQKEWVRDVGPIVETNVGFVETYRDPSSVRAEWEGFVAIVNKEQSVQYETLVKGAKDLIARLPWGPSFEKDVFSSPDFTSLDVLGFASSGIPAGICIPNYDDIRQDVGFKNVYLANAVNAVNLDEKVSHISDSDWAIYRKHFSTAMSVNVGLHELLGHGTGKLLVEAEDGSVNFDRTLVNPLTGEPVATWYKPGETWSSTFGGTSNAYEECRAEAVALYLSIEPEVQEIFGMKTEEDQQGTYFTCWLNMVRAGLLGLEFYSPEGKLWRQAHMRARFCILQVLMRGPNPIVTIVEDSSEGLRVALDASRIKTDGKKAIGDLLLNLNINKSTADTKRGTAYFEDLTAVDSKFEQYREVVLKHRKPRKQFVQPHTRLNHDGTDVNLQGFQGSVDGAIEAFVTRHTDIPL